MSMTFWSSEEPFLGFSMQGQINLKHKHPKLLNNDLVSFFLLHNQKNHLLCKPGGTAQSVIAVQITQRYNV